MFYPTDDLRIKWTKVVLPPVFLEEELPITEKASSTIFQARSEICDILNKKDHRLIVVANREPYQHRYNAGRIECVPPASGMVLSTLFKFEFPENAMVEMATL